MTTLTFRRPTVLPIHPQSWTRPAGSLDFRVTQRFDVPDSYYGGAQKHNAVDLGNFRCGDAVVAMLGGRVRRVKDNATALGAATDALGLVIDHGYGITSEYWHLQSYSVGVVDGVIVAAGQQVATVGQTGLRAVCHLHIEVKRDGIRIDPEPLMFGGPLTIEDEDDVNLLPGLEHLVQATIPLGTNLRRLPTTTSEARKLTAEARVALFGVIRGQGEYTIGGKVGTEWAMLGAFNEVWYVAAPLVASPVLTASGSTAIPLPEADCSAQDATIAQLSTKLARASTSAAGAAQAITATVEALR